MSECREYGDKNLNDTAIECSEDLVKHFREQANQLRARARTFLTFIVLVVLLGALLVIFLPGFTAYMDRILYKDSPIVVAEDLEEVIASRTARLNENDQWRVELAERLNQIQQSPSALWTPLEFGSFQGRLYAITPTPDGGMIAAGREGDEPHATLLLMRSDPGGGDWTPIRPTEQDGMPVKGRLSAVAPTSDGGFIVAGKEEDPEGDTLFIMRSDPSGDNWTPFRPKEPDGTLIRGTLFAITSLPGGGFIAAGWEGILESDAPLFIRSDPSGDNWTPIRPKKPDGTPLVGRLYAIAPASDGGFIAVGRERSDKGDILVLMRSDSSGDNWKRIHPTKPDGTPIEGRLYSITPAPGGGFIAAGNEGKFSNAKPLIMRSDPSGDDWTPIRPKKPDGTPLQGVLYAIASAPDGGFIAAGNEDGTVLSLHSDPSGDNWTPIRPTEPDGALFQGSLRAIAPAPNGGFIAVGNEGSSRGGRNLMIRSLAGDEVRIFPEARLFVEQHDQTVDESREQSDRIISEYETIIEDLERDSLLLPLEVRKQLPLAKDMKQNWERDFNERTSLRESREALIIAWIESEPFQRISRIVTRVAVIVLLIYLVQIMVNLFRYNTRLAAFYQARADAIELLAISNVSLGTSLNATIAEIAAALSPDNVDFGKAPTPPSQQVIEMLGDAAKSVRPGSS